MIDLEQKIRERAYRIWELEGCVHGRDEHHWHLAKLELANTADVASPIEAPAAAAPAKKTRKAPVKAVEPVPAVPAAPRRKRAVAVVQ
jgi:hypothetical protein